MYSYIAEYEDEEFEIIHADSDSEVMREAEKYEVVTRLMKIITK